MMYWVDLTEISLVLFNSIDEYWSTKELCIKLTKAHIYWRKEKPYWVDNASELTYED